MIELAIFIAGAFLGAIAVYVAAVRPLRREMRSLSARMAVVNRRLGSWVVSDLQREADRTFAEEEIPTKK